MRPTIFVLAALSLAACGAPATPAAPPPAAASSTPVAVSSSAPPAPLDCDTLCTRANTVSGCATDPANVPACKDLCGRMLAGACKAQVEAELACAAKVTLACKADGTVDWGACVAEQRAANDCARSM